MITFNVRADNGNWYSGHRPGDGGPWDDDQHRALVLSIEQARELVRSWHGCWMSIEIATSPTPITDERFRQELFCARGGWWHHYPPCDGPCPDCEGRK